MVWSEDPGGGTGGAPDPSGSRHTDRVRIARIRVYPLKGAGGFDLQVSPIDAFGIPGDRRWMLVRPDGLFISQRSHPRLALIRVAPMTVPGGGPAGESEVEGEGALAFEVRAPGMEAFSLISRPEPVDSMVVRVQKDRVKGRIVEAATEWFSDFMREKCRLVFSPPDFRRAVDPDFAPGHRTSFSDGYPLLVTTEESLADLNRRLPTAASMLRFRPNLVLTGGMPWEEDTWRVLETGGIRLHLVKPCARCSVTTVDPGTATRGIEPLKTLRAFRGWGGKAYFGQNAVFSGNGSFRVGENVGIVEKGEANPPLRKGAAGGGRFSGD